MPDMLVKLYDLPPLQPQLEGFATEGLIVRTARAYEKHLVIDWVDQLFGRGWSSECEVAFSRQPISCFVATQHGALLGFACYESTWKNFFGPMGVAESSRMRGIGRVLLLTCLHAMAEQGYAYAIIGATGDPVFYTKTVGAILIEGSEPGMYRDRLG